MGNSIVLKSLRKPDYPLREVGCYPWDVCAGTVIAQEAGGVLTGSHEAFYASVDTPAFGDVTEEILTSRKYLVVRAIGDTPVSLCLYRSVLLQLMPHCLKDRERH